MTGDCDSMRRKLIFRSWHRGTREMDLLLGRFADQKVRDFDVAMLQLYGDFLEESDPDIYDWVCGRSAPPDPKFDSLVVLLSEFHIPDRTKS